MHVALGVAFVTLLIAGLTPTAVSATPRAPLTIQPSSVGANAETVVRIAGSGFKASDKVTISGCPDSNPGAVYPVPFPNPGQGQSAGKVQVIDSSTLLLTTPTVIPPGPCDVSIGDSVARDALTFVAAPERLEVEIVNASGRPDTDVWISAGYNCPLSTPSPPYPPGTGGCDTDGLSNPDYSWPPGAKSVNPNRYWYEVYAGKSPLPAFTGVRLSDLPGVAGKRTISVANIDSGVVYVSYGAPVQTGASKNGRAPSYISSKTRFDVFELTFHGSGTSAGNAGAGRWANQVYANITAVAGLGILMDMSGWDNSYGASGPKPQRIGSGIAWESGLGIRDMLRVLEAAGADISNRKVVVTSDGSAPTASTFLRFVSPSTNGGEGYADLASGKDSYLRWLTNQGEPMTVIGFYTGAGPGQGTWFCYRAESFSSAQPTTLSGTYGHASQSAAVTASRKACAGGTRGLDITTATTPTSGVAGPVTSQAVYMQDNRFLQGGAVATGNDLYNAIYRDFIVSFAYGYWGSVSGDAGWTTATWLDDAGARRAFSAAWPGLTEATTYPRWNSYAEAIWSIGNAYGMPYSDTFGNGGKGNPLVSGSSIHSLRVTLRPDGAWTDSAQLLPTRQRITAERGKRFASAPLRAVGFGEGLRYAVSPKLPGTKSRAVNGIWFVRTTGVIRGTPKRVQVGTTYTITARDRVGVSATATVRLRVKR
ncbi:MAG: Ig domain-containing protein [Actinomycetota bacterium]